MENPSPPASRQGVRLRRGRQQVIVAIGLGRPSADHLASQINSIINPLPLASPAANR